MTVTSAFNVSSFAVMRAHWYTHLLRCRALYRVMSLSLTIALPSCFCKYSVGSVLLRDEASAADGSQYVINMDGAERYTQQMQLIDQQVCNQY